MLLMNSWKKSIMEDFSWNNLPRSKCNDDEKSSKLVGLIIQREIAIAYGLWDLMPVMDHYTMFQSAMATGHILKKFTEAEV